MTPRYRHSDFSVLEACPYAFGCDLLWRCEHSTEGHGPMDWLRAYCCEDGAEWILHNCSPRREVVQNYRTHLGVLFHRFAHAYGSHMRRCGADCDWKTGEAIAGGIAGNNHEAREIMVAWMQSERTKGIFKVAKGEVVLEPGTGDIEQRHHLTFQAHSAERVYSWTADLAKLSADGKTLALYDYKAGTGLRETYDPDWAPTQLRRYAWAYSQLLPGIRRVRAYLWFVNPDHPLNQDSPLMWELNLAEDPIPATVVTDPIAAIAAMPEFPPSPGCWLCAFCEWTAACPHGDDVRRFCQAKEDDARAALSQLQTVEALRGMLNGKAAAIRAQAESYVASNGPIDLGGGRMYGAHRITKARVPSIRNFAAEAYDRQQPEALEQLTPKDNVALATYLESDNPFGGREGAWESIHTEIGVRVGEYDADPEGDDPGAEVVNVHERLGDLNKDRKPKPKRAVTETETAPAAEKPKPTFDNNLAGVL